MIALGRRNLLGCGSKAGKKRSAAIKAAATRTEDRKDTMNEALKKKVKEQKYNRLLSYYLDTGNPFFNGVLRRYHTSNNPVNGVDWRGLCEGKGCFWDVFMPCLAREFIGADMYNILTGDIPGYTEGGILEALRQYHINKAHNHVLKKGLVSWNKSSIYRGLMKTARFAGKINVIGFLGYLIYAEVKCLDEEWQAYVKGGCSP